MNEIDTYKPEDVSCLILQHLQRAVFGNFNKQPEIVARVNCVITVPAYFQRGQTKKTKDAARLAGLRCHKTLKEPFAAALSLGLTHFKCKKP